MKRLLLIALAVCALASPTAAQTFRGIGVRGFATIGNITFDAKESFDTILDRHSGPIFGGGAQALLPWGIYFEVAASRFKQDGQRVFIGPNNEVFKLGIPVEITVTPLEVTGGWRFRRWRQIVPYGGAGYSSYRYKETSEFAEPAENVDERFGGFHVLGGGEYLPLRWLAVGGEVVWSTIADALGTSGVSAAFKEDNLGGTTLRLKISVGR